MRNTEHLESLVGSINKMITNAKNKGIIRSKELYLLNLIYKLISNKCFNGELLNDEKQLLNLYFKLFAKYNFLCRSNLDTTYYLNNNTNNLYINTNPNTAPEIENPDPVEPDPEVPTIIKGCDGADYTIFPFYDFVGIQGNSFTKCQELDGDFTELKILELPTKGILQVNGINVQVNQVFPFSDLIPNEFGNDVIMTYTPIISRGNNELDFISFNLIKTTNPTLESEPSILKLTIL